MTVLERPIEVREEESFEELASEILNGYDGQTNRQRQVAAEQIVYFVERVQPRLKHAQHLAFMAVHHSNIVLGSE